MEWEQIKETPFYSAPRIPRLMEWLRDVKGIEMVDMVLDFIEKGDKL